ncbi:phosphate ABC transporter substrate-binding protein [Lutispora thermophila]|uniref:Phosphate-binding protein n=1 Tax=Lutispora thermophila DSM 19022 TaxID=1122184 RepID=A0A1M6CP70_9FIRM|nr:phosphate ABC transporter substrate-binding protein [Lutispora thermophila]SHI62780.1 phosphate ABC transporter substrate-binding protein, PhoT family (TC 3.A.1.7.1) [Lutispora thermophila DSM 19022]
MVRGKVKLILCLIVVMTLIMTACSGQSDTVETEKKILINGSTSVQPLIEELASAYKEKHPGAIIDIQSGGSGVGIKSAIEGVVDIGMSSRELKSDEKMLKEFRIATDGIAVILNPENPINDLTIEQLKKIYTGEITNWKEVGGKDATITVVTREEGSGTRGAFTELIGVEEILNSSITQGSTGGVMTAVGSDENAIGYASYGSVKNSANLKIISIDGIPCDEENIYSGAYKISRPFLMVTKEEPTGIAKDFIDFILSDEGQQIVEDNNYLKTNR